MRPRDKVALTFVALCLTWWIVSGIRWAVGAGSSLDVMGASFISAFACNYASRVLGEGGRAR